MGDGGGNLGSTLDALRRNSSGVGGNEALGGRVGN